MDSSPRDSGSGRMVTVTKSRGRSIRRKAIPAAVLTAGLLAVGVTTATAANASVPSATAGNSPTARCLAHQWYPKGSTCSILRDSEQRMWQSRQNQINSQSW
jgi:Spy/CpxP family protein refolding chaperone